MTSIILLVSALIALVYTHNSKRNTTPDAAFLASFASVPMPSHVRVLPSTVITLDHAPMYAPVQAPAYSLPDEVEASLAALAHECEGDQRTSDLPRLTAKMEHFVQVLGTLEAAQEIPAPTATEAALCALMGLDWNDPSLDDEDYGYDDARVAEHQAYVIEHLTPKTVTLKTSAERMRAQRAAYAAQGLTARGTKPQPPCNGTVEDPSNRHGHRSCKRKAVGVIEGWTKGGFCSYGHAAQYGLERVWDGTETMEQAKARIKGLAGLAQHAGL